jgi:hypothetical protein
MNLYIFAFGDQKTGSGARTRTVNLAVNSRLLYRLSYSGRPVSILPSDVV